MVKPKKYTKLNANPDDIKSYLEWAGKNLLSMPIRNPAPSKPHVVWPDFPTDWLGYNSRDVRFRPTPPSHDEIKYVDEILELILLVPDINTRRILQSRSLVAPINNRFIYSWEKIARFISLPSKKIRSLHTKGLLTICEKITPEQAERIKKFYSRATIHLVSRTS